METLSSQFKQAITNISVNGDKRERAIAAHTEIRTLLEDDEHLCGLGVDTVLIGSYARKTGIYPGKDVDVFAKLTKLDTGADPREAFDPVARVLAERYSGRAEAQRRSIKVSFDTDGDGFAVDVVPAVRYGERWALPNRDRDLWEARDERWIETDPERLGELTVARNRTPTVGDGGAYVPTVKLVRQIRKHNLGDAKPGGLYFELLSYWAFEQGVSGDSHAEILAATLGRIATLLGAGIVTDPVLGTPYSPTPDAAELEAARQRFSTIAGEAEAALSLERCPAAAIWRRLLGSTDRGACFPLPEGCDEDGRAIGASAATIAAIGSQEAGGFGRARHA